MEDTTNVVPSDKKDPVDTFIEKNQQSTSGGKVYTYSKSLEDLGNQLQGKDVPSQGGRKGIREQLMGIYHDINPRAKATYTQEIKRKELCAIAIKKIEGKGYNVTKFGSSSFVIEKKGREDYTHEKILEKAFGIEETKSFIKRSTKDKKLLLVQKQDFLLEAQGEKKNFNSEFGTIGKLSDRYKVFGSVVTEIGNQYGKWTLETPPEEVEKIQGKIKNLQATFTVLHEQLKDLKEETAPGEEKLQRLIMLANPPEIRPCLSGEKALKKELSTTLFSKKPEVVPAVMDKREAVKQYIVLKVKDVDKEETVKGDLAGRIYE